MNQAKVAAALNTIAVAFGELAEAIGEAGLGSERPSPFAGAAAPVLAPPTAIDDDFPPFEPNDPARGYESLPLPADAPGLGRCPTHGTAWSVKNAGVSKAGKAYNSFWKCDGKDDDGTYCNKKPVKAWADAHPLA